jgi:hypothetical protein
MCDGWENISRNRRAELSMMRSLYKIKLSVRASRRKRPPSFHIGIRATSFGSAAQRHGSQELASESEEKSLQLLPMTHIIQIRQMPSSELPPVRITYESGARTADSQTMLPNAELDKHSTGCFLMDVSRLKEHLTAAVQGRLSKYFSLWRKHCPGSSGSVSLKDILYWWMASAASSSSLPWKSVLNGGRSRTHFSASSFKYVSRLEDHLQVSVMPRHTSPTRASLTHLQEGILLFSSV